jgi:hypothetical protein
MKFAKQSARFVSRPIKAYLVLSMIYTFLILILPANRTTMRTYSLTSTDYRLILLAVALPSLVVWLAAFISYGRLNEYSETIKSTTEGRHFKQLAKGTTWLAWSLPISAIVLLSLGAVANQWSGFNSAALIIGNYVSLLLPLIAFTIIGGASRGLVGEARLKLGHVGSRVVMLAFVILGVLYCYLIFRQFDLTSLGTTNNPYLLPIWLAVLTITVPYLYAWFVGLLAAYEISVYGKNISGVLYRQAMYFVVLGLVMVIGSLVALQYINGVQPRVGHLVLNYKLPVTTVFRIIGGIGFALITTGALRLKKIEEV